MAAYKSYFTPWVSNQIEYIVQNIMIFHRFCKPWQALASLGKPWQALACPGKLWEALTSLLKPFLAFEFF
jgi:hypothetical protein